METSTVDNELLSANDSDNSMLHRNRLMYSTVWVIGDLSVLLVILTGNVLTILAIRLSRQLRKVISNQLVLSLAVSDLMVGFAVLYHLCFYSVAVLDDTKVSCILRFILLFGGCCASFFNVTAIALDRYLAIVHPLKYPEYMNHRLVYTVIASCWCSAVLISTVPSYWNTYDNSSTCEIDTVIPSFYLVAILAPIFLTVWLSILMLYSKIWKEAKTHAQRWQENGFPNVDSSHWKSNQVVLLVLGCFTLCWLPYVLMVLTQAIYSRCKPSPTVYHVMFSIAMCNSGINPLIYAWKNQSFRTAFLTLLRLRSPDHNDYNSSFKKYLRKQSELETRELEKEARNELGPALVYKASGMTRVGEAPIT